MKIIKDALTVLVFTSLAAAEESVTSVDEPEVQAARVQNIPGVNDQAGYAAVAKKFVGVNPKQGEGSGFVIRGITTDDFPGSIDLVTNTGRNNMCTCDCAAGPDGVGCIGWAGIAFKYSSLLWCDPYDASRWNGQMQAFQPVGPNGTVELNFMGSDVRLHPGGPAIYNVACTDKSCSEAISGTFRQANSEVSCEAGIADEALNDPSTCFQRCANVGVYAEWLAYCKADTEDVSLGFSGYKEEEKSPKSGKGKSKSGKGGKATDVQPDVFD